MEKFAELFLKMYPINGISAKKRILLHCVFWLIMFIGFWQTMTLPVTTTKYNFIVISYYTLTDAIFFYIFVYLVSPLWDNNQNHKYLATIQYGIIFIMSLAIIFNLRVQLIYHYDLLKGLEYPYYSSKFYNSFWGVFEYGIIISLVLKTLLTSLPAFFIKLIFSLIKSISEKKQVEIDYLRSQINPHFLTNTLNNIYSLSVTDDKRNSDAILSLSSLLDYVLYEANQPTISLDSEVNFLTNFIELEKIRNSKRLQVNFEIEGNIQGSIPPMILITFVENAFKHSIGDLYANSFIKILLKVDGDKLYFEVENNKSDSTTNKLRKTFGGIGLTNVKKRLLALHPESHSLIIQESANTYKVKLKIPVGKSSSINKNVLHNQL